MALTLLVIAVGVGAFWLLVYWVPRKLTPLEGLSKAQAVTATNGVRSAVLQAAGGLALVAGVFWTARTWHLNREGQLAERFSQAVAQLGAIEVPVRIGAIYALSRIAKDSRQDRETLVAVLADFVRTRVPRFDALRPHATELAADVQAAMRAISRRPNSDHELARVPLRELCLSHLDGAYGDWLWVDFGYSHLYSSQFMESDCRNAAFHDCDISNSSFAGARLNNSIMYGANLAGTFFCGADLTGATLKGANLERADLSGRTNDRGRYRVKPAILKGAHLGGANLRDANFDGVDLRDICCIDAAQLALASYENARMTPEMERLVKEVLASGSGSDSPISGSLPSCRVAALSDSGDAEAGGFPGAVRA